MPGGPSPLFAQDLHRQKSPTGDIWGMEGFSSGRRSDGDWGRIRLQFGGRSTGCQGDQLTGRHTVGPADRPVSGSSSGQKNLAFSEVKS